jgi:signal transduction histidine kinase
MSSSQKANFALALALILLCLSGIAAGLVIFRLYEAQLLVRHTYEVEVAIGDVESSLTAVGRSRVAYVNSPTPQLLQDFTDAIDKVAPALAKVRRLTADNPEQLKLCDRLEANANDRLAPSRKLVELKQQNQYTPAMELQLNTNVARSAFDTAQITGEMKQTEDALLEQRTKRSSLLFVAILTVLAVSFALAACMFGLHYFLLNREFHERREAENQLRHLSLQLLRVQDEEHRRFARELHDGVGQILAAAKMIVSISPDGNFGASRSAELSELLSEAISHTRTISYLFHPPLLDEIGFASAAKWLIEGFSQRTGLEIAVDIPQPDERLSRHLELTLYRVLQEALNNIHRHSKSSRAEVALQIDPKYVVLRIKDYGRGIPDEKLAAFNANATRAGVGLLSMKERVREQSGELKIGSHAAGTEIIARIPNSPRVESEDAVTAY